MWICQHCHAEVQADWDTCWNCLNSRADASADVTEPLANPIPSGHRSGRCSVCQSSQIMPNLRIFVQETIAVSREPQIEVVRNPGALVFRGAERGFLRAWICGGCGYTELYATDHERLWTAYQEQIELDAEVEPLDE